MMQEGVKAGLLPEAEATRPEAEGTRLESGVGSRESGVATDQAETPGPRDVSPPSSKPQTLLSQAPGPTPQASGLWRVAVPWAAAAAFALATSYQALWVVPGLRQRVVGPEVLSPITLRGAARGTEPTLTRPAAGVMAFAVDLAGVAAGASLTYDLRAADGVSVAEAPGAPLPKQANPLKRDANGVLTPTP